MKETDLRFFSCKMSFFDGNKNRVDINILQTFGEYIFMLEKKTGSEGKTGATCQNMQNERVFFWLYSGRCFDRMEETKEGISKKHVCCQF